MEDSVVVYSILGLVGALNLQSLVMLRQVNQTLKTVNETHLLHVKPGEPDRYGFGTKGTNELLETIIQYEEGTFRLVEWVASETLDKPVPDYSPNPKK